jgi:protein-disulfide isomerase
MKLLQVRRSRLLLFMLAVAATMAWPAAAAAPAFPDWVVRLFENPLAPRVAPRGAPKAGDVTVVEFFDYNCPYCKAMHPVIVRVLAGDRKVRVVYRDWPVLGPVSVAAARAAIASQYQGRHDAFHAALFAAPGRLTEDAIRAAAVRARVDWARLERDRTAHGAQIDALIRETLEGAQRLGLQGTPVVLVGRHLLAGALTEQQLRDAIAQARAEERMPTV